LTDGARITSPSPIAATAVPESGVPAEKSATVVSPTLGAGIAKLAGAAGGFGDVEEFANASAEVAR